MNNLNKKSLDFFHDPDVIRRIEMRRKTESKNVRKDEQKQVIAGRFIIKEAEYLMKCGRYINAIESLNQILDFLSKFDLGRRKEFGDNMTPQTQLLLTTRAEAWLRLCKMEYALQGSFHLL